ncbi:MAG: Mpo1 family 2-hydroxy fatty acid dioxygenase [Bdellovibrionota bacterium]
MATATRLSKYFKDYASHHKNPSNKLCHYVGIPMITISTLGLFGAVTLGGAAIPSSYFLRLDLGVILWVLGVAWYLYLDWKIAIPFALFAAGFYFLGRSIPVPALWAIFALGWVIQFVGHIFYEKKSPAFFKNLEHLLIGPLWIFAQLVGYE